MIFDTDLGVPAATYMYRRLSSFRSRAAISLFPSSDADLLGGQIHYVREQRKGKLRMKQSLYVCNHRNPLVTKPISTAQWRPFGAFCTRGNCNYIGMWYNPCRHHLCQAKIQSKRNEEDEETWIQMEHPNCFHVCRTATSELYISTPMVAQDPLGEIRESDLSCCHDAPPVPNLCICGCNWPIGWDNVALDSTA
jgi:hypothetical protein